ncbi:hypothetical protein GEMRC1_007690 [Eukaryota sp. GEM-RC1]
MAKRAAQSPEPESRPYPSSSLHQESTQPDLQSSPDIQLSPESVQLSPESVQNTPESVPLDFGDSPSPHHVLDSPHEDNSVVQYESEDEDPQSHHSPSEPLSVVFVPAVYSCKFSPVKLVVSMLLSMFALLAALFLCSKTIFATHRPILQHLMDAVLVLLIGFREFAVFTFSTAGKGLLSSYLLEPVFYIPTLFIFCFLIMYHVAKKNSIINKNVNCCVSAILHQLQSSGAVDATLLFEGFIQGLPNKQDQMQFRYIWPRVCRAVEANKEVESVNDAGKVFWCR